MVKRKVYFDNRNGSILAITAEGTTGVRDTTELEDIQAYTSVTERNRNTFDVIELEYGEYAQEFAESNGRRVNPETKKLEFSYPVPGEPEAPQVFGPPLTEQIEELRTENYLLKAQTQAISERADFHEDLIADIAMMIYQ